MNCVFKKFKSKTWMQFLSLDMIYSLSDNMHFGKYKGVNVLDVFTGVPFLRESLPEFINYAIEMLINQYVNSKQSMESLFWQNDEEAIVFNGNFELAQKVSQSLIKLIYSHTTRRKAVSGDYLLERFNREVLSKGIKLAPISGNPYYIEWALKNVAEFCFTPDLIPVLSNIEVYAYSHINFKVESNKLFFTEVCYNQYKYPTLKELYDINLSKFENEILRAEEEDNYYGNKNE